MARRPQLTRQLLPCYQAFYDLRPEAGEFSGVIGWRSVASYCSDLGMSTDFMEYLFDVLRKAQAELDKSGTRSTS